jgi:ABC-type transport system involved in multi-copper enzyme maturation permease subunit
MPSRTKIAAVVRKELTEFRRNRLIVITMAVFPVIFVAAPTIQILTAKVTGAIANNPAVDKRIGLSMLYLMMMPVAVPSTVSGYSIVGERDQGTLEPLLATPVSRTELILGKAGAIFIPSVGISYVMFGAFIAIVKLGASAALASTVFHAPQLWAGLAFSPLLCAWSIWVGLAISSKVSDTRVSQQLTLLASVPPLAVVVLFSFGVINATLTIALVLGAALLVIDLVAWMLVAQLFDRERLVTGSTARPAAPATVVIKVPPS